MKTKVTLIIISIFVAFSVKAQFYNYGQDRASIRWNQYRMKNYRLIYPYSYTENAKQVLHYMEWLNSHKSSINITPKNMAVVLHSEGGVSNGMVTWAPRVTNLYTLPQQTPHDYWLLHLTAHEYRHTEQMAKVNQHFTKVLYYIFGDIAPVVAIGAYVPTWYLEGDAVTFETSIGNIGRGRDPEFLNYLKAQVLEKGIYSYNKATLGSYTDYVPNHYVLGYYLCATGRVKYGNNLWSDALTRVAKRPYGITPFNRALKLGTEKRHTRKTLYEETLNALYKEWSKESVKNPADTSIIITTNQYYTNYYSPILIGNDSIIAYKNGYEESGAIVLIHNGEEKTVTKTGILYDKKIAFNGETIIWAEYLPHYRYSHGGREVLCSYNLKSNKFTRHKNNNNRYAPFTTPDGWGCVEIQPNGNSDIVLLDYNMNEITRINGESGELYIHPTADKQHIYTTLNTIEGNSIVRIEIKTHKREYITQPINYMIDYPQIINDTLYYVASFNTNNAIYRYADGKSDMVLETKYGVTMPAIDKNNIVASAYTADGYKPISVKKEQLMEMPISYYSFALADSISKLENFPKYTPKVIDTTTLQNKRYHRGAHLFSIHSWGPLYANAESMDIKLGASIYSQNRLNTMAVSCGYLKLEGYDSGVWRINATYRGWWPIIGISGEFGKKELRATDGFTYYNFEPRFNKLNSSIQLPISISKKDWSSSIIPYIAYNLEGYSQATSHSDLPIMEQPVRVIPKKIQYVDGGISISGNKFKTNLDILPKYGFNLRVGGAKEIGDYGIGDMLYAHLQLNIPGMFKHHSITLYCATQQASKNNISGHSPRILRPRGITLKGADYTSFRSTYTLPICYPELGIGSILYIKRIFGSLFYDYGTISLHNQHINIHSAGAELKGDINLLRLTYPLNIGVRAGYETLTKSPFAELLFSISLSI